jgi:hypothetical protein
MFVGIECCHGDIDQFFCVKLTMKCGSLICSKEGGVERYFEKGSYKLSKDSN